MPKKKIKLDTATTQALEDLLTQIQGLNHLIVQKALGITEVSDEELEAELQALIDPTKEETKSTEEAYIGLQKEFEEQEKRAKSFGEEFVAQLPHDQSVYVLQEKLNILSLRINKILMEMRLQRAGKIQQKALDALELTAKEIEEIDENTPLTEEEEKELEAELHNIINPQATISSSDEEDRALEALEAEVDSESLPVKTHKVLINPNEVKRLAADLSDVAKLIKSHDKLAASPEVQQAIGNIDMKIHDSVKKLSPKVPQPIWKRLFEACVNFSKECKNIFSKALESRPFSFIKSLIPKAHHEPQERESNEPQGESKKPKKR